MIARYARKEEYIFHYRDFSFSFSLSLLRLCRSRTKLPALSLALLNNTRRSLKSSIFFLARHDRTDTRYTGRVREKAEEFKFYHIKAHHGQLKGVPCFFALNLIYNVR